jgi:protein-tyrosine phosphatase
MPTLIHCAMGINRSAILLADYLATITGKSGREIMGWIHSLRPITFSNPGFVSQMLSKHGQ